MKYRYRMEYSFHGRRYITLGRSYQDALRLAKIYVEDRYKRVRIIQEQITERQIVEVKP